MTLTREQIEAIREACACIVGTGLLAKHDPEIAVALCNMALESEAADLSAAACEAKWKAFCKAPGYLDSSTCACSMDRPDAVCVFHSRQVVALRERTAVLEAALSSVVSAVDQLNIRALVSGWNGEECDKPYEPHSPKLRINLSTRAGYVYEIDKALSAAHAALNPPKETT
jgi:hypothetical protein